MDMPEISPDKKQKIKRIIICVGITGVIVLLVIAIISLFIYDNNKNNCTTNSDCQAGYMCASNKCTLPPNPTSVNNAYSLYYYSNGTSCVPCSTDKAIGLIVKNNLSSKIYYNLYLSNTNTCSSKSWYTFTPLIASKTTYNWLSNINSNNQYYTLFENSHIGCYNANNSQLYNLTLSSISSPLVAGDTLTIVLNPYTTSSTPNVLYYQNNDTTPFYSQILSNLS